MNSEILWDLFNACDADGSGYIGRDEVRDICSKFKIETEDADAIFENLDRDRDGQISFEDFKEGFTDYERDFSANPLADKMRLIRKQVHDANNNNQESNDLLSVDNSIRASNLKRVRSFTRRINRALESEEPMEPEKQAKMIEEVMDSLNKLKDETETLAKSYLRERREHEEHLYRIEQDVDSQVRQVEQRVTERAKQEIEAEKRSLRDMMKDEMLQLQNHLSMFEKVENWLKNSHTAKEKEQLGEVQNKLEEALAENHQMRLSLLDTQTAVAMMRSELGQLKSLYDQRCKELNQEREKVLEVVHNQDYLSRQLMVLQNANQRFEEIADNLQERDNETWGPNSLPSTSSNYNQNEMIPSQRMKKGSIVGDYLGLNVDKRSMISNKLSQLEETIIREEDSRQAKLSSNNSSTCNDEADSGLSTITRSDQDEITFPSTSSLASPMSPVNNNNHHNKDNNSSGINQFHSDDSMSSSAIEPSLPVTITENDQNSPDIPGIVEVTGPGESLYNLIFIGDMAVGKTALIYRLAQNQFLVNLCSTVGVDFHVKSYCVDNSKTITVQLWDTGGQERFRSITLSYFRKADGVILVYDLTLPKTFLNARNWMNQIKECSDRDIPCVLVGNKLDLRDPNATDEDQISYNRGYKLAEEFNCPFFEISAKHGVDVVKALEAIIRKMMENDLKKGLLDPKAVVKLDAKSGFWAKKKCSTC